MPRVQVGTGIDPASFLDEGRERHAFFGSSDIPQRPRPFADRLAVELVLTCATDDDGTRIGVSIDG
jgi:hypothetical protein